jgi:hypothetical protein
MKNTKYAKYAKWLLPLLASIALISVALSPKTGWLVKPEMTATMGVWPKSEMQMLQGTGMMVEDMPLIGFRRPDTYADATKEQVAALLAAHPNDRSAQMIGALQGLTVGAYTGEMASFPPRLREMAIRHPESPEICATVLRFAVLEDASLKHRYEADILTANPIEHKPIYLADNYSNQLRSLSEIQAEIEDSVFKAEAFISEAQRGAALDPNNAYFLWMQSIGLFALNRDEEAIQALHQAAQCSTFDDYIQCEAQGIYALSQVAGAHPKAITVLPSLYARLYPHYASLRVHGHLVAALAIERERQGDSNAGMRLRRDLAQVSQIMQASLSHQTGYFVGIACERAAYQYPGARNLPKQTPPYYMGMGMMNGMPMDSSSNLETAEQALLRKQKAWHDYAMSHEATALADRPHLLDLARKSAEEHHNIVFVSQMTSLLKIAQYDVLAASALTMSMVLLLLGGIFGLFARHTRIREEKPANRAVAWGIGINITIPLVCITVGIADSNGWSAAVSCVACAIGGILLGIAGTRLIGAEGTWPRRIGLFIGTLLTPAGILALLAWVFTPSVALPLSFMGICYGLNSEGGSGIESFPILFAFWSIWSIPLVHMLILTIASRIRRIPATVGVARGFMRWALPLASVLALLYALTTPYRAAMHDQEMFHVKQIAQSGTTVLTLNQHMGDAPPSNSEGGVPTN